MLSLRLVLDTNVVISAALKPEGIERTVFLLAITKPARMYVSAPILEEYRDVLSRKKLGIRKGLQRQFLQLVQNRARVVVPTRSINIAPDAGDNMFLECADAARADYLVTGNRRDFPAFWKSTKIVSARELVDLAAPHLLD